MFLGSKPLNKNLQQNGKKIARPFRNSSFFHTMSTQKTRNRIDPVPLLFFKKKQWELKKKVRSTKIIIAERCRLYIDKENLFFFISINTKKLTQYYYLELHQILPVLRKTLFQKTYSEIKKRDSTARWTTAVRVI